MKIKVLIFFMLIGSVGLFAQSYKFEVGKKFHIFQYRANIREEPGRNGNVLAILNIHDQVEILENSHIYDEDEDDPYNIFFEYLPDGTCKVIAKHWNDNGYWEY